MGMSGHYDNFDFNFEMRTYCSVLRSRMTRLDLHCYKVTLDAMWVRGVVIVEAGKLAKKLVITGQYQNLF